MSCILHFDSFATQFPGQIIISKGAVMISWPAHHEIWRFSAQSPVRKDEDHSSGLSFCHPGCNYAPPLLMKQKWKRRKREWKVPHNTPSCRTSPNHTQSIFTVLYLRRSMVISSDHFKGQLIWSSKRENVISCVLFFQHGDAERRVKPKQASRIYCCCGTVLLISFLQVIILHSRRLAARVKSQLHDDRSVETHLQRASPSEQLQRLFHLRGWYCAGIQQILCFINQKVKARWLEKIPSLRPTCWSQTRSFILQQAWKPFIESFSAASEH